MMQLTRVELAKKMALEAGNHALSKTKEKLIVSFKDTLETDPVTNVDRECEALIVKQIQKNFPEDRILGEEGGFYKIHDQTNTQAKESHYWVIDPLDGTQNYLHGLPLYCVSIAYIENHKATIGVIYAPVFNELFVAERGKGATLNGNPIAVSEEIHDFTRHFGTSALSLAWLADGRLSLYKAHELFPWDFAAGALIVEEANGYASTLENTPLTFHEPQSFFASNHRVKQQYFETLP